MKNETYLFKRNSKMNAGLKFGTIAEAEEYLGYTVTTWLKRNSDKGLHFLLKKYAPTESDIEKCKLNFIANHVFMNITPYHYTIDGSELTVKMPINILEKLAECDEARRIGKNIEAAIHKERIFDRKSFIEFMMLEYPNKI